MSINPVHQKVKLASAGRFNTYADYIIHLVASCGQLELEDLADALVHGSLSTDGNGPLQAAGTLLNLKVSVFHWHKDNNLSVVEYRVENHALLYEILRHSNPTVEYRAVFLHLPYINAPIPTSIVDALGLGLDMPPEIWLHLLMRRHPPERQAPPHLWRWKDGVLEVGNDLLLSLKQAAKRRICTGKANLVTSPYDDMQSNLSTALMILVDDTGFQGTPSLVNVEGPSSSTQPHGRLDKTAALREWIIMQTQKDNLSRHGNVIFLCLEALLHLHMSTTLSHTSCLTSRYGPLGPFNDFGSDMSGNVDQHTRMSWEGLQSEIQMRRETLLAIPDFMNNTFDMAQETGDMRKAYASIRNRYERHIQCLELSASRLKETLAIKSSAKNIAMGEVTIKESKRLMLCEYRLSGTRRHSTNRDC
jgi:hypothetical protein